MHIRIYSSTFLWFLPSRLQAHCASASSFFVFTSEFKNSLLNVCEELQNEAVGIGDRFVVSQ